MKCKCLKCGHEWLALTKAPKACPSCKRYDWQKKNNLPGKTSGCTTDE